MMTSMGMGAAMKMTTAQGDLIPTSEISIKMELGINVRGTKTATPSSTPSTSVLSTLTLRRATSTPMGSETRVMMIWTGMVLKILKTSALASSLSYRMTPTRMDRETPATATSTVMG